MGVSAELGLVFKREGEQIIHTVVPLMLGRIFLQGVSPQMLLRCLRGVQGWLAVGTRSAGCWDCFQLETLLKSGS